jgi:hypothetical protein
MVGRAGNGTGARLGDADGPAEEGRRRARAPVRLHGQRGGRSGQRQAREWGEREREGVRRRVGKEEREIHLQFIEKGEEERGAPGRESNGRHHAIDGVGFMEESGEGVTDAVKLH